MTELMYHMVLHSETLNVELVRERMGIEGLLATTANQGTRNSTALIACSGRQRADLLESSEGRGSNKPIPSGGARGDLWCD